VYTRLNTILLPEDTSLGLILKTAHQIFSGRPQELFHIDNRDYFAHLTLYSPEYPSKNLAQVSREVEKISRDLSPITLNFQDLFTGWGFVGLDYTKDRTVDSLHHRVLNALNPLRDGHLREKYAAGLKQNKYPSQEANYIRQYGYPNILSNFHPHITLGKFSGEDLAIRAKELFDTALIPTYITFSQLAVSEMGPYGTCTKILSKFSLHHPSRV